MFEKKRFVKDEEEKRKVNAGVQTWRSKTCKKNEVPKRAARRKSS